MGIFDDLPNEKSGLFDDLPNESPVPETPPIDASKQSWLDYSNGLAQKIANGVTFNWGDEIAAGMGSGFGLGPRVGLNSYEDILRELNKKGSDFEKTYPKASLAGELGGSLATGAGGARFIAGAPTWGLRALRAAGVAAPAGALNETGKLEGNDKTFGDYAEAAGEGAGKSALAGGLLSTAGSAVGATVGPWVSDAAQRLLTHRIPLTIGETIGGYAKRLEDIGASAPFIGNMIRNRQREGIEGFNLAAVREALRPDAIASRRFHPDTEAGFDAAQMARGILNRRYDEVVPRLRGLFDQQLDNEVRGISTGLPQYARPNFADAYRRHVEAVIDPATGAIDGRGMQHALGALRDEGRRLMTSPASHAYDHDLGAALMELRERLIENAGRYTPARTIGDFRRIQEAYRGFATVRQAGSSTAAPGGVFTPTQLHMAVKAGDKSAGKGAMSRGEAHMQQLSDDAKTVMTRKVNDSGTPERAALLAAIAAPAIAAKSIGPAMIPFLLYTRPGQAMFRRLAAGSPQTRMMLRRAIENATAAAAPSTGVTANALNDQ